MTGNNEFRDSCFILGISPMGSISLFVFIYVLFSLFCRWLFGMVLRKGNPWKRDFIGFLPGFFLLSFRFLWILKFTFIAKIWFIFNILIFSQILHNFKVSVLFSFILMWNRYIHWVDGSFMWYIKFYIHLPTVWQLKTL